MKAQRITPNQAGKRIALVQKPDGFAVYIEMSNYSRFTLDGIRKTWGFIKGGMNADEANALFTKKVAGRR